MVRRLLAMFGLVMMVGCSPAGTGATNSPSPPASATAGSTGGPSSGPAAGVSPPTTVPLPSGAPVPEFTGPYAAEFKAAYVNSTSDLQRKVLQDGRISEAEMAALADAMNQCVARYGISGYAFDPDGSDSAPVPPGWTADQVLDVLDACTSATMGEVLPLYQRLHRNPQNQDEASAMAECLVRVGLAPAGYTADDYRRDTPDHYPFDSDSELFARCAQDPVNARP